MARSDKAMMILLSRALQEMNRACRDLRAVSRGRKMIGMGIGWAGDAEAGCA